MSATKVTVVGGGNAAFTIAACMSLSNRSVTLYDFPEFASSVAPIKETGAVDLIRQDGPFAGKATIDRVTTNVADAVRGAELIVVCAQAHAHGRFAREAAPYLEDAQLVLLLPGSCFGAWEFRL